MSTSIWTTLRNWLLGAPDPSPRRVPMHIGGRAAAQAVDHECAPVTLLLPQLLRSIAGPVAKRRRKTTTYIVDLAGWSCTCPYAVARNSRYGERDIRRVCKHLSRLALDRPGVLAACDAHVAAVLERGVWSAKRRYSRVFETRFYVWPAWPSPVYLGITPQSSWVSVVTRRKNAADIPPAFTGEYFMFSYNTEERAWAYDARPPGARLLRDLLGTMEHLGFLTAPVEPLLAPEDLAAARELL